MDQSLRFSVAELKDHKREFHGSIDAEAFGEPLSEQVGLTQAVRADLEATWTEERVWLKGRASGRWELECCRCLTKTRSEFDVPLDATFEDPDDAPEGVVDGLEEIRQALLLSVPTQPYCREDCKGLCPQCGADKNVKECGCRIVPPTRFKITKRGKSDA